MAKRTFLIAAVAVLALLAAAALALWRRDIPYAQLEARYSVPTSHYVELPGQVRLHYRDDGDPAKPAVILVHGYGDSFASWTRWITVLSPDFHVLTIDLPGHGLTRAPEGYALSAGGYVGVVEAFADRLGLQRYALVGNSMGGGVAWLVAARQPQRVEALVLVDAAGWPRAKPAKPPPLAFRLLQTPAGVFVLKHFETRAITRGALRANVVRKDLITPAFLTRWQELHRAPGHRDILMSVRSDPGDVATPARLAAIRAPTLVLWGAQDAVIPLADGRRFASAIPGARMIVYPDAGHTPQWDVPERSAADVAVFLRGVAGR